MIITVMKVLMQISKDQLASFDPGIGHKQIVTIQPVKLVIECQQIDDKTISRHPKETGQPTGDLQGHRVKIFLAHADPQVIFRMIGKDKIFHLLFYSI
jgi:hypothetical protein